MSTTVLITGFGPFPGAPFNPTQPLARELARRRHPAFANVRRVAHVFPVSYAAIDRELPALLKREQPDALVMFGLATRTRHLRVETRARNALAPTLPDVGGHRPMAMPITPGNSATLPLPAPAARLLQAARTAGMPSALSRDAGRYLCNYLCWRAAEAARTGMPRLVAFIHVPIVASARGQPRWRPSLTLDDLTRAGEAIVREAVIAARLVSRFRSSHNLAAATNANFGIKGTLTTL